MPDNVLSALHGLIHLIFLATLIKNIVRIATLKTRKMTHGVANKCFYVCMWGVKLGFWARWSGPRVHASNQDLVAASLSAYKSSSTSLQAFPNPHHCHLSHACVFHLAARCAQLNPQLVSFFYCPAGSNLGLPLPASLLCFPATALFEFSLLARILCHPSLLSHPVT